MLRLRLVQLADALDAALAQAELQLAHVHWRDVEASVVYERVSPRGVASAWWTSGDPC